MLTIASKQTTAPRVKREVDVEKILTWAYREELPKRQLSSAEGIWRDIAIGRGGLIGNGESSAQRYASFGLPHPDADRIESAVSDLPMMVIDWDESLPAIMGDLAGLLTVNDLRREQEERGHITHSSWPSKTYSKTERRAQAVNRPRDVIFAGSIDIGALVTSHARQGTRPRWYSGPVACYPTPSRNDPARTAIVGECRGRNIYSTGSCCPLTWRPSLLTIAKARADYLAWWRGLAILAQTLVLDEHTTLAPAAAQLPWFDGETVAIVHGSRPPKYGTLPLKPQRATAGPTRGQGEDIPKRYRGRRVEA